MIKQVCKGLAVTKSRTRVSEIISSSYYCKSPLSEPAWPIWSRLCKEQAELQRQMSKRLCKIYLFLFSVSIYMYYTLFLLINSLLVSLLSFFEGILICKVKGPGPCHWSLVCCGCCSVTQFCVTLRTHGLQHARLLCPSLSPSVCSNSCPLNWWCHPTISSSVTPFFCFQPFPVSGSFQWVGYLHQVAKVLELQLQCLLVGNQFF